MGAIAGIISRDRKPVMQLLVKMLKRMDISHYNNYEILLGEQLVSVNNLDSIESSLINEAIGICSAASKKNEIKIQSLLAKDSFFTYLGQLSNKDTLVNPQPGKGYDLKSSIPELLNDQVDGFVMVIKHRNEITLARDLLGIKPLYISENDEYIAFANEKKALWEIGQINSVRPVHPGELLRISARSINTSDSRTKLQAELSRDNFEACQKQAKKLLIESIMKRIKDNHDAVLFSGGLDSTIIAQIIKQTKKNHKIQLFTACFKDSKDYKNSTRVAEHLGLPLTIVELTDDIIEESLPDIIYHLETPDTLAVEIAIPLYFATKAAAEDGFGSIFSGQGADELYAGYSRYERILKLNDYQTLHEALFNDVMTLCSHDLERDSMISSANDIELVLPYLDLDFVEYSLSIPPEFKLKKENDKMDRKHLLYTLGNQLGLEDEILNIPKTAAQYGSGASKSLKRIATKYGYNTDHANKLGFKTTTEILTNLIFNNLDFPDELKNQIPDEVAGKLKIDPS